MVDAICQELASRNDFFSPEHQKIHTLYFGGGTPSVLAPNELSRVFQAVRDHYDLSPQAEITLEANPEDLQHEYLEELVALGLNRLSIGFQSLDDHQLKLMNRSHSAAVAVDAIEVIRSAGINNFSIDLIYGLPGSNLNAFTKELQQMTDAKVPHLSLYALTLEPKTAMAAFVEKGKMQMAPDKEYRSQFLAAHSFLEEAGYDHYELSNYALKGFQSQHNSAYWERIPYLGIGPSAHSFDGKERCWNISNNQHYINQMKTDQQAIVSAELITPMVAYNEYIMTQLRTKKGIQFDYIEKEFGRRLPKLFPRKIENWVQRGYATLQEDNFRLSPEGWLVSDAIISELFATA